MVFTVINFPLLNLINVFNTIFFCFNRKGGGILVYVRILFMQNLSFHFLSFHMLCAMLNSVPVLLAG
jgi:hypothetical protein